MAVKAIAEMEGVNYSGGTPYVRVRVHCENNNADTIYHEMPTPGTLFSTLITAIAAAAKVYADTNLEQVFGMLDTVRVIPLNDII